MELVKWKLLLKNIADIKRIIIFSINQNNLINIVKQENEIYFYTIKNQQKVLIQIDETIFNLNLNEEKYNFENNNVVKAILFIKKIGKVKFINEKQNKIDDRYIYCRDYNSLVPEYTNHLILRIIRDILNHEYFGSFYLSSIVTFITGIFLKSNMSSFLIKNFIKQYNINTDKYYKNTI